ncbi:hypothetical protein BV25DRAFT_1922674 [Artomyces pyxidatus]|nr:hypothetical protein BV25DRAFT_1922674 [Artomyces pyxidatus]
MSYEIITGEQYEIVQAEQQPVTTGILGDGAPAPNQAPLARIRHDFIHDLESFFWVLVWIGMSREGPGIRRTTWPTDWATKADVRSMLSQAFEISAADAIADRKNTIFHYGTNRFNKKIVQLFAPYFDPDVMGAVVQYLYSILRRAYDQRQFSMLIYDEFDSALAKAEKHVKTRTWNDTLPAYKKMADDILTKREEDDLIWESPNPPRFREHKRIVLHEEEVVEVDSRSSSPSPNKKRAFEDMVLKTSGEISVPPSP